MTSKSACPQTAFVEPLACAAWAQIIVGELLDDLHVAVDRSAAALDAGFRREAAAALAHRLEKVGLSSLNFVARAHHLWGSGFHQ